MNRHHPPRRALALLVAAATVATLLVAGCTTKAQPTPQSAATPVRVAPVTMSAGALPISAVGTLEPATSSRLSFKVGGPIARLYADEGDRVRSGQLLAELASDEIDAAVRQAEAALEKARRDAERMERLYRDSVVTLAQFQDAQTGFDVAESAHTSATFNQRYARIVAPASGRVLHRQVEQGELVAPGATVFEIGLDARMIVRTSLTDRDVVRVQNGGSVAVTFDALPGQTFDGRIVRVAESANERTGAFDVEVEVASPSRTLRSGFIARLEIAPGESDSLATIPPEALVRAEGRTGTVYVLDDARNAASERHVTIAGLSGDKLVIASGLEGGEQVVTDGAPYLTDDAPVTIVPASDQ